jgi:hypothetical protein
MFQRPLRQGHVTIAVAFARADVQEHAPRINVAREHGGNWVMLSRTTDDITIIMYYGV